MLIGHPKLRNDLRRPQMEEIGYRTTTFEFEGVSGHRREFIGWLVKTCAQDGVKPVDIMDVDAIELLAERLRTALQIEMHLTLAFEHAFRLGEKRVPTEVVEQVLSRAIDELEPTLTRNGYDAPALTVLLRAKPAEVLSPGPARDRRHARLAGRLLVLNARRLQGLHGPTGRSGDARMSVAPIVCTVQVKAAPARAFVLFATHMEHWWPKGRTIGKNPHTAIIVESRAGGRWFERDAYGNEAHWGKVLEWEPPSRLLLGWQISCQWGNPSLSDRRPRRQP